MRRIRRIIFWPAGPLPWWAIGASLIAANISAEQIIGMSGSAYVLGFAIASYEWMAALTLIIVGKYLLPVFLKHRNLHHAAIPGATVRSPRPHGGWRPSGWVSMSS